MHQHTLHNHGKWSTLGLDLNRASFDESTMRQSGRVTLPFRPPRPERTSSIAGTFQKTICLCELEQRNSAGHAMEPKEFERAARLPPAVAGLAGRQRGGACCNSGPAYDCAPCRMTRLPCIVTDMSLVLRLALQLCTADGASSISSNSASRSVISGSRGDAFARKNRASSMYALACAESMRVKLAACSADSGSLSCSSCSWKRPILRARLAVMTESPISRHASRWIDAMRGVSMPSVKESNVPAER
jgi:hypothetical protein